MTHQYHLSTFASLVYGVLFVALLSVEVLAQQKTEEFARPVDRYVYAQGLKKGKIYDFAQKAFEDFIRLHPGHELEADAWSNVIDCLRKQSKHDEMIQRIEAFRKRWKTHANLDVFTYWEGESYMERKIYDKAQKSFESLLSSKNKSLQEYSMFLLANCFFQQSPGNPKGYELYATIAKQPLQKNKPYREIAVFELARYKQHQLKYAEALQLFDAIAAFQDAKSALREEAVYSQGEIYFAQQQFPKARVAYDRFLTLFPRGRWSNEVRKRRAEATYQMKQIDQALKMVLEWRNINPNVDDFEMDCLHGRCLYQLGEYGAAWPHFEVVVKNGTAPVETRRYCLVYGIHCLLEDGKTESWRRGLEMCALYLKDYHDVNYENKVFEFKARLHENLKEYQQAFDAYETTLKTVGAAESSRKEALMVREVHCLQELKQWVRAAGILRVVAQMQSAQKQAERVKYLLWAADLELKLDKASQRAEQDYRTALSIKECAPAQATGCHERLLSIYLERKDHAKAHGELTVLLPNKTGDELEMYLFRDAWLLAEMKKPQEALQQLRKALDKKQFSDEKREVDMRLLMLTLLQEQLLAGKAEAGVEMVDHYRKLAVKPRPMTDKALTPAVLYQLANQIAKCYESDKQPANRKLLEDTFERIVGYGYATEPSVFFASYKLANLYMERSDGRFQLAEACLSAMTQALDALLKKTDTSQDLIRQLGNPENLLRESLSLLAVCQYELQQDAKAMATAESVLGLGMNYASAKRCLLVQAKIYYHREPKNLTKALEKLANYNYIIGTERNDAADEEEALVLLVAVQHDMQRYEGALEAYRQLKMRYPERAKREPWSATYERKKDAP